MPKPDSLEEDKLALGLVKGRYGLLGQALILHGMMNLCEAQQAMQQILDMKVKCVLKHSPLVCLVSLVTPVRKMQIFSTARSIRLRRW